MSDQSSYYVNDDDEKRLTNFFRAMQKAMQIKLMEVVNDQQIVELIPPRDRALSHVAFCLGSSAASLFHSVFEGIPFADKAGTTTEALDKFKEVMLRAYEEKVELLTNPEFHDQIEFIAPVDQTQH